MDENEKHAEIETVWKENELHAFIMGKIEDEVFGCYKQRNCRDGSCFHWKVRVLDTKILDMIVSRGNHVEIMQMIEKYGKASIPIERAHLGCTLCNARKPESAVLPEDVQEFIARRNDKDEIRLYLSFWGFGAKGQSVVLERGDHDELMYYIDRHGFLPKQQKKLIERGNQDEIELHIKRHGLSDVLLDEIFYDVAQFGKVDDFYRFINNHELRVKYQKKMLETVKSSEFRAYVDRYGLWIDAHDVLVSARSIDDIRYYIRRHPYLSTSAEEEFYSKASREDLIYYLQHKGEPVNIDNLLRNILYDYAGDNEYDYDYDILTAAFLRVYPSFCENSEILQKITSGTREEVWELVSTPSKVLTAFALATLFFKRDKELFERYLKNHSTYFY